MFASTVHGASMTDVAVHVPAPASGKYRVGTLRYTRAGLFALFGWLLWGDFCFTLMEKVLPEIYPLFLLNRLGVSNTTANILMTTIPQVMVVVLCPPISFRSDRTRSNWGRRIPYMVFTAPLLCLFLVGLGFSDHIAGWLKTSSLPGLLRLSPYAATVGVIGLLVIAFSFFNDFVGSVYYYLFADVVPKAFLGRFLGLFRLVGIGADVVFRKWIFPHANTHMHWIFLGAAILYGVGFGLMCWRVKEGEYPPLANAEANSSVWVQTKLYFRECYRHPLYVLFFCHGAGIALAQAGLLAQTVYWLSLPSVDMQGIGNVMAKVSLTAMVLTYPAGWLCDTFHPLRTCLVAGLLIVPAYFGSFLWLRDYDSLVVLVWLTNVLVVVFNAGAQPLRIALLPPEKYGQFSSANSMLRSGVVVIGGLMAGLFLDRMTAGGQQKDGYRWIYAWSGACQLVGMAFLAVVYVLWKRRGGMAGYTPPGSIAERQAFADLGSRPRPFV
jgi:maltose/moltooligosaccharide transporter